MKLATVQYPDERRMLPHSEVNLDKKLILLYKILLIWQKI